MSRLNFEDKIASFSLPRSVIFAVNNGGAITFLLLLLVFVLAVIGEKSLQRISVCIIIMGFMTILVGKFMKRFAQCIRIDFASKTLVFVMFRSGDEININFKDLERIRANVYISFILNNGRKIFYNNPDDKDIYYCIDNVKKIEWGPFSKFNNISNDAREDLGGS